ncbi:MAG: GNAT family N-acetyltransferase [Rubrimonas sp.]
MTPGPTLRTERLILRPPRIEDFARWAAMMAHPSSRFMGGPMSEAEAWRGLCATVGSWALTGEAMFSVLEAETGLWVGRAGPLNPVGWPAPEVGWGLHHDARGRGYATEAAAAAMDYAVDVLGWTDVIHVIDPANLPSQGVARRLGSTLRGPVALPPPWSDSRVEAWGQTAAQWRARRGRR